MSASDWRAAANAEDQYYPDELDVQHELDRIAREHGPDERRVDERRLINTGAAQNLWHGFHEDADRRGYGPDRRRGETP